MKNYTRQELILKGIKNSLYCLTEDAKNFGGYVTVITRYRGNWNGKTYKSRLFLEAHKGVFNGSPL